MGLMGVLTEIGLMRCSVLVLLSVWSGGAAASCPSLCSCRGAAAASDGAAGSTGAEPPPGEPLRLRCGGGPAQITELKEIDFTNIWSSVISLNMSGNAISTLSRELHLPNLQKLDLSRNQISLIESDAFYNMSSVQRLDLSHNQISSVYREMFKGLVNLERLLLAHNLLATLAAGTFDHLVALKQLDITENRLVCDCALLWLGEWLRASGVRAAGVPRCAAPPSLAGKNVRKLRVFLDLAACGAARPPAALALRPERDQLVFEGDALALVCAAPFASALHPYELRWTHPLLDACDVNVTSTDVLEEGAAETTAFFPNVTAHHAGAWTCAYSDDDRVRHERTVRVVVLSNRTRYCATDYTVDNKGPYAWPTLLLNRTAEVPCRAGDARATRACGADGRWGRADTSRCGYLGNVTKLLQQFALLDAGLVQYSALNASARLAALLRETARTDVRDPDDVMFVARAARNYMRYVPDEKDLGSALLDVISAAMLVPQAVMARAERQYGACSELLRVAERLASTHTDKQKSNLAVESFPVRAGFGGATCVWYSAAAPASAPPRLHCTTTNRTVARLLSFSDARVHASVQIPASLVFSLAGDGAASLVVSMFLDAALFPLLPDDETPEPHRAKDYYGRSTKCEDCNMEITSPVVSVRLENGSVSGALLEPVIATLRAAGCGAAARCAVWDPASRRWRNNDTECAVLHVAGCTAVVALARPGAVALLARAERGIYGARTDGARFKVSHPAVYVGSLVLVGCLTAAALTYAAAFPAVLMPRRAKHALLNTWLAVAALGLLYALGIYQTEDARLCRALGLLLHYLSLCCLLWMCVAAHVTRESVARGGRASPPDDAPAPDGPARRPVLGLYLVGWGAALIVCGISGAVNLREYAGYAQCFLSSAPALGALLVPAALLLPLLLALLLLARRAAREHTARLSEGTQATEHVELDAWEPPPAADRRSLRSADSELSDAERAPGVLLRAQAVVLALFLAAWTSGAVAVYRPLPAYLPYQEDICSILYAVCATVLGTFVLFFYGIARSDVRAQWALVPRLLRRGERCCRKRGVGDSARPAAPPAPAAPEPGRERSASRGSGRAASKASSGAIYKAGAELNGQTLPRDARAADGKSPNINLVVLHRRQYRSDNSMTSHPDSRAVGPEAFYNPNQMNVAKKFFKKQRQNVKRNCLELPVRRDFDDESRASSPAPNGAPYADIVNAGSKVNNTNIHVERSAGGIKETRRALDPNVHDEDEAYKSYSVDREPQAEAEGERPKGRVVNIYTNVPETLVPQHHVAAAPDTRTVSAQCSLDYSSASSLPRSCSDRTLDTSELNTERSEPPERSRDNDVTDTESFGRYIDYLQPARDRDRDRDRDETLRDISEEGTVRGDDAPRDAAETDRLLRDDRAALEPDADKEKTAYDFETCSTNASEQGFENESDIYCPNYQMSEVSIRSHGLYAPSPSSMCPNEISFSAEDVSHAESQYVNFDPGWRSAPGDAEPRAPRPAGRDSPASFASDLDELYTRIAGQDGPRPALDVTAHSDVTLRPDSDSAVSEAPSDPEPRAETAV